MDFVTQDTTVSDTVIEQSVTIYSIRVYYHIDVKLSPDLILEKNFWG